MRRKQYSMLSDGEQRRYDKASNPETSAERLTELSAVPHLRSAVAGNAATPANLLEHLAQDQDPQVRLAVAGNPKSEDLASWQESDYRQLDARPGFAEIRALSPLGGALSGGAPSADALANPTTPVSGWQPLRTSHGAGDHGGDVSRSQR